MRMIFIVAAMFAAFVLWYAVAGRAWLKSKPWAQGFFAVIEPIEIRLYKKSETILWARLKMLVGVMLTALTLLGTIDLTPVMPFVPEAHRDMVQALFNLLPMVITLVGMADEKLRNSTSKPLELVAAPDHAVTPQVARAIAVADEAKLDAVAAVVEAKAA
jgi:hypothetical protein